MHTFPKSARLRSRADFRKMAGAKRLIGSYLIIDYRVSGLSTYRLGLTVSRKYGKAHERNRFKRLVREAFRKQDFTDKPSFDLNIRPRSLAKQVNEPAIEHELKSLLRSL